MNVVIAALLSGLIGVLSVYLAAAVFPVLLAVIYVRGYLVPGTPTLTMNYFPDRVLGWFDKDPTASAIQIERDRDVDIEKVLRNVGIVEERKGTDDLAITDDFRDEWHAGIDRLDANEAQTVLGAMLGIDAARLSVRPRSRSFEVKVDGEVAGEWESKQAFVADMAAERVLHDRVENWTDLPVDRRSGLLRGVRVYLERCPRCAGPVTLSEETVKSCCRSREVLASRCQDCGVRLFEIEASQVERSS